MIRLKELRKGKGLTTVQAAKIFGVSKSAYNYWENGVSEIDFAKLKEISKYFDVSIDYLLDNSMYYYSDRLTNTDRLAGISETKNISITPLEDDMLYAFREIGKEFGVDTQKAAVLMLENMTGIKR